MILGVVYPISNVAICPGNCSGHGECLSGTCLCQVQFSGWACNNRNLGYFLSFGILFYVICLTSIIQLVLCIYSDFVRRKKASNFRPCSFTIQKLIYVAMICASGSRAVYFTLDLYDLIPPTVKEYLFSTFYAFVMSGFSLVICFWAESFHLSGLNLEKPQFLTKSMGGFIIFNAFVYILLIGQLVWNSFSPHPLRNHINEVINGGFAFLMFCVLVFFLIYGVEIFCKVKGAFKPDQTSTLHVDLQQLFQSRLGLIAQAAFQLTVTMLLMSEVLGELWKQKTSVGERNIMRVLFHVAELACALWFPCCLWNVHRPGELWILNPRKLLLKIQETKPIYVSTPGYNTFSESQSIKVTNNQNDAQSTHSSCWICLSDENPNDMITPCDCKGGMKSVHHDCLKRWLVERPQGGTALSCTVCRAEYNVAASKGFCLFSNNMQFRTWAQTFFVLSIMSSLPVIVFATWKNLSTALIKMSVVLLLCLGEYFFLRLLGIKYLKAYKITKARALKILGRPIAIENSLTPSFSSVDIENT